MLPVLQPKKRIPYIFSLNLGKNVEKKIMNRLDSELLRNDFHILALTGKLSIAIKGAFLNVTTTTRQCEC